jgi:hypothetical protein
LRAIGLRKAQNDEPYKKPYFVPRSVELLLHARTKTNSDGISMYQKQIRRYMYSTSSTERRAGRMLMFLTYIQQLPYVAHARDAMVHYRGAQKYYNDRMRSTVAAMSYNSSAGSHTAYFKVGSFRQLAQNSTLAGCRTFLIRCTHHLICGFFRCFALS